jgi:hypothetical protein
MCEAVQLGFKAVEVAIDTASVQKQILVVLISYS